MGNQKDRQFHLPKNIRQMGKLGDTCQIYVEDFVYTYVHRTLHEELKENDIPAAVLLGKTYRRGNQEYIFISGAQQVDFAVTGESAVYAEPAERKQEEPEDTAAEEQCQQVDTRIVSDIDIVEQPSAAVASQDRQQIFWEKVYQGIKEYFSEYELLGWYFSLEGSNLEITTSIRQFFDATQEHGSRFLYYEDRLNRMDAFFVQEQGHLQRLEGYAVYYEKNPAMQEFLVAQNRHTEVLRQEMERENAQRADVAQNYRAILNKLNEKPARKQHQPFVYVAGIAVLAVVVATGISQIGNYQNLKVLEHTLQTFSGNVQTDDKDGTRQETPGQDGQEETKTEETMQSVNQKAEQDVQGEEAGTEQDVHGGESGANSENVNASESGVQEIQKEQNETTQQKDDPAVDTQQDAQQGGDTETQNQEETTQQTSGQEARYYTVKKGDSLMSISKAVYHTTQKVQDICDANQIQNMDMIYEGQRLVLP